MKKKLIAVAVAGALGAPAVALAQASTVQIYGTIIVNYNYADFGAGKPKVDMMNAHDANIGFKGEEALGGGLSAWFQCESTADVTGEGAAAADTHWCGRNSGVGFKGAFGNIFYGIWDTPLKVVHGPLRPYSTSGAYGMGGMLWNEAGSDVGNGARGLDGGAAERASFTRRQINTVNYYTPNLSGFQGMFSWSTTDEATALTDATVANKARLWSLGLSYTNGPLYLMGGYERHKDYNPANQTYGVAAGQYNGGTDTGWHLGAGYTFANKLKITAIYASQTYDTLPGQTLDHKGWGLFGDWNFAGPHRVRASFVDAKDGGNSTVNVNAYQKQVCVAADVAAGRFGCVVAGQGIGDTGSRMYTIQYAYGFSKRTEVNFGYSRIDNDRNARQRLQTMGPANTGQDQSAWVLGVKHTF